MPMNSLPAHLLATEFTAKGAEPSLSDDYFRLRDFEYVQPLYDLAFLLEIEAICREVDPPKYRTFSLWRAAYSLDGYGTTIDRWLDRDLRDADLDYVPSHRIKQYLKQVRQTGSLRELREYRSSGYRRCLRLRGVRGLGPSQIALAAKEGTTRDRWLDQVAGDAEGASRVAELYDDRTQGPWQTAHIVPPLLRFLKEIETVHGHALEWDISGIEDPLLPVTSPIRVAIAQCDLPFVDTLAKAMRRQKLFRRGVRSGPDRLQFRHQQGWCFAIEIGTPSKPGRSIGNLAQALDPLAFDRARTLRGDLHMHTAWSDGSASVSTMAQAVVDSGLQYFAVTDHSRSSKLQSGLTPILWLRQANALTLASPVCPVLHGIEVDILKDGMLDLPHSLLAAADIVVASVHSSWSNDERTNTNRLIATIETGCIDIIAHPTSAIMGKPGVPNYVRAPAAIDWEIVFQTCAKWRVAVELNCFPSRLDLPLHLLKQAIAAGCAISFGSDAHARSHLQNLRFGESALHCLDAPVVLNRFSYEELRQWIAKSRSHRATLPKSQPTFMQGELVFEPEVKPTGPVLRARIQPPQSVPAGSRVVGIDLTAGDKETGVAILDGFAVETCSVSSDADILALIQRHSPDIVSIDSPLGLPGGGDAINPKAGIVRIAESDLASVGIPAYPALIDSMKNLTLRGIGLRKLVEALPNPPRVIESYPGAAQDILCIPRKQKSLELLREGLRRLGLTGPGLETRSHDEMDAITSAIVGRYFESGLFEPMGVPSEAQLIVPKIRPLVFDVNPVICLAGKTGAGKSVVARYLSLFYGFAWVRTRDVIRDLLAEDMGKATDQRLWQRPADRGPMSEVDLREFGAVVLDKYRQVPLREHLIKTIRRSAGPVVVDSIRDVVDVDRQALPQSTVLTWFVDCSDLIIQQRLVERARLGQKLASASPVDRTANIIRGVANATISNFGSLEELRWRIDDTLFRSTEIHHGAFGH